MKYARSYSLMVIIILGLSFCVPAWAERDKEPLSDRTIQNLVEHRLLHHENLPKVEASVQDQIVTLRGTVASLAEKKRAEHAARVDDVLGVNDELTIMPADKTDAQLAEEASKSIRSYAFFDIYDWISGKVNNGQLILTGWVHEPWRKLDYQRLVEEVPGIASIDNKIEVLPNSTYDDELRVAATRLIYGDSMFRPYASQPYPPIHIIVDNGSVRLEGVVATRLESQRAEMLLRSGLLSFEVVNDLKIERPQPA